jgi:hypothetical protein
MRLAHISNTDLEFEMREAHELPLEKALTRNPIVHQLQFLPLLYAREGDGVGVTDMPLHAPTCHLLSEKHFPYDQIESWGFSRNIAKWAKERGLAYPMPLWDVVKEVNSKAFSFQQAQTLPNAQLINTWKELEKWIKHTEGRRVLKSCFGLSGQGHLLLPAPPDKIKSFAMREFNASRPLIAEPWVHRKLDFSTQWIIGTDQSISYVGSTILLCDEKGRYCGTKVGDEEKIFGAYFSKLLSHKEVAHHALKKMASLGFFGNVGIDSMIWGSDVLHPIVEINARKTMGWIALQIAKRLFPNESIKVSYETAGHLKPLLPQEVAGVKFARNLYADIA